MCTHLFEVITVNFNSSIFQLSPFPPMDFPGGYRPVHLQHQVSPGQAGGGGGGSSHDTKAMAWPGLQVWWVVLKGHFPMETFVSSLDPQAPVLSVPSCQCQWAENVGAWVWLSVCIHTCARALWVSKTSQNSTSQKPQSDFLKLVQEKNKSCQKELI